MCRSTLTCPRLEKMFLSLYTWSELKIEFKKLHVPIAFGLGWSERHICSSLENFLSPRRKRGKHPLLQDNSGPVVLWLFFVFAPDPRQSKTKHAHNFLFLKEVKLTRSLASPSGYSHYYNAPFVPRFFLQAPDKCKLSSATVKTTL